MATLLEKYNNRLTIAESAYNKFSGGEKMSNSRKIATAQCLQAVDKFLTEAYANSVGTQRADMGMFKKFALDLTTIAVPNLIAHELVIVSPMASMSGYVNYLNYTYGSNKGGITQGQTYNNPFKLGDIDANYSSQKVVEAKTAVGAGGAVTGTLNWNPLVPGMAEFVIGTETYRDGGDGQIYKGRTVSTGVTADQMGNVSAGTVTTPGTLVSGSSINYTTGEYSFTDAGLSQSTPVLCNYVYDNAYVPQNDIPLLNAKMETIPLLAKPRRLAIFYSQLAAYQAKTDYSGLDLNAALTEQAVGMLSYEIDTEITQLLIDNAADEAGLVWSKTLPVGVSKSEHYNGFSEVIEIGRKLIYDRTKRFSPNYMLVSSSLLPVMSFINGWTAAPVGTINGPYLAGTINGIKVFVTPNIGENEFVMGVNGSDMRSSAAVYAPYMAIVPTQLLQYADGGTSQGFSTLYDLKMLNPSLLVKGHITA